MRNQLEKLWSRFARQLCHEATEEDAETREPPASTFSEAQITAVVRRAMLRAESEEWPWSKELVRAPAPWSTFARPFSALAARPAAAAAVLLLAVLFFVGATTATATLYMRLLGLRQELGLDTYVIFAGEDAEHPSTEPRSARPLCIVGRSIIVKGKARPSVISRIEVTVDPPLAQSIEPVVFAGDDRDAAVEFQREFEAPADGALRIVTVRLVPRAEARAADPRGLDDAHLTYRVPVACLRDGPVGYVSAILPAVITSAAPVPGTDNVGVTVVTGSPAGSYVTLAIRPAGTKQWIAVPPVKVHEGAAPLEFTLALGEEAGYEVRSFSAATKEVLNASSIAAQAFDGVVTGDIVTLTRDGGFTHDSPPAATPNGPPIDVERNDLARFINPPRVVVGNTTEISVEVDPALLIERDVWLGVIPSRAAGSVWPQDERLVATRSRRRIYLGVNEESAGDFEVVVLSSPKGEITKVDGISINSLDARGIQIVNSVAISRAK